MLIFSSFLGEDCMSFAKDFTWGAATAAYQVEGAYDADGRGLSIWDVLSHKEGKTWHNDNGDVSCDHYHLMELDVDLMKQIGLQAYRFSFSWPRLFPEGTGAKNQKGFDFYNRLIDTLLEHNIEPWGTIFHWDYPEELFMKGGWLNSDSSLWFADYTAALRDAYGDRVKKWFTLNEPQCFLNGHMGWTQAPNLPFSKREVLRACHNVLLSHGRAARVLREVPDLKVGMAPVAGSYVPQSNSDADIQAARQMTWGVSAAAPLWSISWFMDPVFFGTYPEHVFAELGNDAPVVHDGDMSIINQVPDFYGYNIYTGKVVRMGEDGVPHIVADGPGQAAGTLQWAVVRPEALYWNTRFWYERYKKPIVISENGLPGLDWVCADGHVHDDMRIDYTGRYLQQLEKCTDEGIPVSAYFHWSLMDNFEWNEGYKDRFGLIFVDYKTQKRTLKDSAYWYRDVIQSNGAVLHNPEHWFDRPRYS